MQRDARSRVVPLAMYPDRQRRKPDFKRRVHQVAVLAGSGPRHLWLDAFDRNPAGLHLDERLVAHGRQRLPFPFLRTRRLFVIPGLRHLQFFTVGFNLGEVGLPVQLEYRFRRRGGYRLSRIFANDLFSHEHRSGHRFDGRFQCFRFRDLAYGSDRFTGG
jgi:hypothetical protein